MKKVLSVIAVSGLLFLWAYWAIRSDYAWADNVIREKQGEGWVVASTTANVVDITHPWTIVKSPTVRVAFVRPSEAVWLNDDYVLARVLWVDYEGLSETKEEMFQNIYDCKRHRVAHVGNIMSVDEVHLNMLEWWETKPNTPGEQNERFVCSLK